MPDEIITSPTAPVTPDDTDPHAEAEADAVAKEPEVDVKAEEVADASETEDPAAVEDPAVPAAAEGDKPSEGIQDAVASEAEDAPVAPSDTEGTEGTSGTSEASPDPLPAEPQSSTDGTDGASGASAPAAADAPSEPAKAPEEAEATPDKDSPYGGLHDVAKPLEPLLGIEVIEDLEDAAALLFHARERLNEANLDGLDPELAALVSNLRNQGAGILAALEGIFRRIA